MTTRRDVWREVWSAAGVPEGAVGDIRVVRREQTASGASLDRIQAAFGGNGRYAPPGLWTMLMIDGQGLVMSDTPDEYHDHFDLFMQARGRVLVHGLGLACAVRVLLTKPEVDSIDVVEINRNVIDHVGPTLDDPRVTIHHDDALTARWPRGARWDVVWHDIWPAISADNAETMGRLHRRFGGRCEWQGSWARALVKREQRQERAYAGWGW